MTTTPVSWSTVARFFHWSTAVLILAMFVLGWLAVSYPLSPTKLKLFNWHKSLGLFVLAWVLLRLLWRLTHPAPALPAELSPAERWAARLSHGGLYCLMIAMPASGWVINSAADFPLKWFGLFAVPQLVAPDEALQDVAEAAHFTMFWALLVLIILHTAAALHHHFVRKNNVLRRMLPFTGAENGHGQP
jgi:cytochrome b561